MPALLSLITTKSIPNMNNDFMIESQVSINNSLFFVSKATQDNKKPVIDGLRFLDGLI